MRDEGVDGEGEEGKGEDEKEFAGHGVVSFQERSHIVQAPVTKPRRKRVAMTAKISWGFISRMRFVTKLRHHHA